MHDALLNKFTFMGDEVNREVFFTSATLELSHMGGTGRHRFIPIIYSSYRAAELVPENGKIHQLKRYWSSSQRTLRHELHVAFWLPGNMITTSFLMQRMDQL
jgi:GH15 family glucan-1,4-alpha-glucosidase